MVSRTNFGAPPEEVAARPVPTSADPKVAKKMIEYLEKMKAASPPAPAPVAPLELFGPPSPTALFHLLLGWVPLNHSLHKRTRDPMVWRYSKPEERAELIDEARAEVIWLETKAEREAAEQHAAEIAAAKQKLIDDAVHEKALAKLGDRLGEW